MVNDKPLASGLSLLTCFSPHSPPLPWDFHYFWNKKQQAFGFFKRPGPEALPCWIGQLHGIRGTFFLREPPVVPDAKEKVRLLALEIVFPYIDIVTIAAGNDNEEGGFKCFLFLCELPANVATLSQFFFYLCQIVFGTGDIQGVADGPRDR